MEAVSVKKKVCVLVVKHNRVNIVSVDRATALKAGGRGFKCHLSSLFSMKIEKRVLRFIALFAFKSLSSHAGYRPSYCICCPAACTYLRMYCSSVT